MFDIRPAVFPIGILVFVLGLAMLVPAAVDYIYDNPDWRAFLAGGAITIFFGGGLSLATRAASPAMNTRQAFLFTSMSWVVLCGFGALPLYFGDADLGIADSVFESVSGLTTTGSTVMAGLDTRPPGVLLWRSILQWLGGIGIIVFAVALLPMLQVGGMQLFKIDSSNQPERELPKVAQIAAAITGVYVVLTVACVLAYVLAGMNGFEAINHAMTTVATGGYSTRDASVGGFDSAAVEWVAILFMTLGALPFLLYVRMVRGTPTAILHDPQVQGFVAIVVAVTAILLTAAWADALAPLDAVRRALFNGLSIITGTGYAAGDYGQWGGLAVGVFFFATFVGGCAGSTSCGIRIFRWQVLAATLRTELSQIIKPHTIRRVSYGGRTLTSDVIESVMVFVFVFFLTFAILAVCLALTGLDTLTALSGAATAVANVGPGLGETIGPAGNFAPLSDTAKWLLIAGMLLGRLEFFTLMVLFTARFWRD